MHKESLYLATITVFLTGISLSASVFADTTDTTDEIGIEIPISCTMSGTGTNTHYASIPNGIYSGSYTDPSTNTNYANGIGTTTIKAFCNDNQGFSIYAIGYTDNIEGKTTLSNEQLGSTYDIITGTATGPVGSNDVSNWSMKLSTITSPTPTYPIAIQNSFDSYHEVPDDYTLVAKRESATDVGQNAVGSTLTTTYAAYISKTQPAGLYEGQVKYTMVHPHDATKPEIVESPSTSCTTPVPNYTYMQDINSANISSVLTSLTENSPYFLRDKRDNQPYCVAKLRDGKLWMTENLNIAGGIALSSEDTDFVSTYTLPTTGNWTVTDGKLILPVSATKNPDNNNLTDNSQFNNGEFAYVFNSGNKENCGANGQNIPCYSYYSWDAATLGSGRTIATDNTDAPYSICPKNWRLPISGRDSNNAWKRGDFYTLATNYGINLESDYYENSSTFYNQAGPGTTPDFLLAGYYNGSSFSSGGSYGYYWSSTSHSSSWYAQGSLFGSSSFYSAGFDFRGLGYSVRCLLGV